MGQPIEVLTRTTPEPGVVRFETNRWLTGMGHERYASVDDIVNNKTIDQLARRLFDSGEVAAIHASGSVVTVQLRSGADPAAVERLADLVRELHIFYPDEAAEEATAEQNTAEAVTTEGDVDDASASAVAS